MWGRITLFLGAALVASLVAGAWFGHLLVKNAPVSPVAAATDATLSIGAGEDQRRIPEPPQPLMDGSIGIPVRNATPDFGAVPLVATDAAASATDAEIEGAPAPGSIAAEPHDAASVFNALANAEMPSGNKFEVAEVEAPAATAPGETASHLPPELAFAVALPAEPQQAAPAWQGSLRAALGRCGSQRFFSPDECEQRLRIQYCDPNGGWGRIPECPAGMRNVRY